MRPWQPVLSIAVLAATLLTTLLRTLRAPNDWAEAHWLLDYRFGFVKRGLPGELLRRACDLFGVAVDARTIALVGGTLLAMFALLLLAMAVAIVRAGQWRPGALAVATAFLASPFVVMTGHLNGYFEHLFLPLGIASWWLVQRGRPWPAALLQALALLVHEMAAVLVLPTFALALWFAPERRGAGGLLPLALPLVTAVLLTQVVGAPPDGFAAGYGAWLREHAFVQGAEAANAPLLLAMPLGDYWQLIGPKFGERMAAPGSIGLVLPTLLVLLAWLLPRLSLALLSPTALLLAAVVLLPQAMHRIAFDLERIWTFSLFTTFAACWLLRRVRDVEGTAVDTRGAAVDADADREPRGLLPLGLLVLAANFVLETPLLDLQFDAMPRGTRLLLLAVLAGALVAYALAATPVAERTRWLRRSGPR